MFLNNMNPDFRCGHALLMLLIIFIASGCASNKYRDGAEASDLSGVYVGMPRTNFEDLVGKPIEQSETREQILATYEYDRGYIGCKAAGRCLEVPTKTTEVLVAIGTLGFSEANIWYDVHKCQLGYLGVRYGPEGRLINIRVLPPEPFKGGTYLWDKEQPEPKPWYPCREIYYHPQPLTAPDAVLDKDISSASPR